MAFYLVDYENVNAEGLQGIDKLRAQDEVIIFYSEHADRLTFDLHQKLNQSEAQVHYFKVGAGKKNALDFQLVSYLGYLAAQHPNDSFFIVSRDNGFQNVIHFWSEKQINVRQTEGLEPAEAVAPVVDALQLEVEQLFAGDPLTAAVALECLRKSHGRQELHNLLAATLRNDGAGAVYQKVKQLL